VVILTLGGFAVAGVLALAGFGVVNEATAAIFVLIATILWTRQDAAAREARVRATLAREIARNLDFNLPRMAQMRRILAPQVRARLASGEPLLFLLSPDDNISLRIYGAMIPTLDAPLAERVMEYFDAEKAVADFLRRIEDEAFSRLSREGQDARLAVIEATLDEAIRAGREARSIIARHYGLAPARSSNDGDDAAADHGAHVGRRGDGLQEISA
jgi:hypothetical protein